MLLLAKMFSRVAFLVLFVAEWGVSRTSCSSEHIPEAPASIVNQSQTHNDGIFQKYARPAGGMGVRRAWGAAGYLDVIVTTSVMLATLFLLIRCATYIYEVARLSKGSERRVAEGDACGGEVSYTRQVLRCVLCFL